MASDKLLLKTVYGLLFQLDVNPYTTIRQVKEIMKDKYEIPISEQMILYYGKQIPDDYPVAEYIGKCCLLFIHRLRGG